MSTPAPMTDAELTAIEAHSSTAIEARLLAEVRRLRTELTRFTSTAPIIDTCEVCHARGAPPLVHEGWCPRRHR